MEHLSVTFRKVLLAAQQEARLLNQDFVSAEHVVLAMTGGDCEAAAVLRAQHVRLEELREKLRRTLPRPAETPLVVGDLPLSPKVHQMINAALVRARALQQARLGTRLFLLALLEEQGTALRQIVESCGADLDGLLKKLSEPVLPPEI